MRHFQVSRNYSQLSDITPWTCHYSHKFLPLLQTDFLTLFIRLFAITPWAKTINVFRACLGAQLTICAQKWRNFILFSTVSLRFVLSRVCVFLYSLGPMTFLYYFDFYHYSHHFLSLLWLSVINPPTLLLLQLSVNTPTTFCHCYTTFCHYSHDLLPWLPWLSTITLTLCYYTHDFPQLLRPSAITPMIFHNNSDLLPLHPWFSTITPTYHYTHDFPQLLRPSAITPMIFHNYSDLPLYPWFSTITPTFCHYTHDFPQFLRPAITPMIFHNYSDRLPEHPWFSTITPTYHYIHDFPQLLRLSTSTPMIFHN